MSQGHALTDELNIFLGHALHFNQLVYTINRVNDSIGDRRRDCYADGSVVAYSKKCHDQLHLHYLVDFGGRSLSHRN